MFSLIPSSEALILNLEIKLRVCNHRRDLSMPWMFTQCVISHVVYTKELGMAREMCLFHRTFNFPEHILAWDCKNKRRHFFSVPIAARPHAFRVYKPMHLNCTSASLEKAISNSFGTPNHVFLQLPYARQSMKASALWPSCTPYKLCLQS